MYHFIHSSVELFSFHLSTIVNNTVMNMSVQIFLWISTLNQFSSLQSLSRVWFFVTPWTAACQDFLFITYSRSLLKLMSIKSVMPSNHLILSHPLLLLPSIFPSIKVFTNESVLHIGWPKFGVLASVLPVNIKDCFPLGWIGWISLQSKGLSGIFSNITVQMHQFFGTQFSLSSNSYIHSWLLEKP